MYLYFNNQGVLKEIINDDAIRQGNSNINKIRFFIEGAEPQIVNNVYKAITFITGVRTFIDVEGNQLTTESISLTTEELEIPYNKKRELKFFKYFTKYEMFSITVPDDILNESGTVGCRVQMVSAEGIITLGLIVFNVEITTGGQAIIEPDTAINIAQWNYLISNMLTPEKYVVKYDVDASDWDLVPTEGSTKLVTSGGIATAIANALSAVYKLMGTATTSDLNDLEKTATMNGYVYNVSNAGTLINEDQTTVSISADDNVVFIWNDGEWYWDRLGSIFDTSNLVTTNTAQIITSLKRIRAEMAFVHVSGASNVYYIGVSGSSEFYIKVNSADAFVVGLSYVGIYNRDLLPNAGNTTYSIGSSSARWKDGYFSGSLYATELFAVYLNPGEGDLVLNNSGVSFRPSLTNSDGLGTSDYRWKDGWINNLKGVATMTQAQYDALAVKDADTLYFIEEE